MISLNDYEKTFSILMFTAHHCRFSQEDAWVYFTATKIIHGIPPLKMLSQRALIEGKIKI
jgi:ABC-type maltose transport system permease subunit